MSTRDHTNNTKFFLRGKQNTCKILAKMDTPQQNQYEGRQSFQSQIETIFLFLIEDLRVMNS